MSDEGKHEIKGLHYLTRTQRDGKAIAYSEQVRIWKATVMTCLRITTSLHSLAKTEGGTIIKIEIIGSSAKVRTD
jgi:hypothetical protein